MWLESESRYLELDLDDPAQRFLMDCSILCNDSTNENGVPSLLFDGASSMSFDGVNFNGKSELTMIVVSHYTGEAVTNPGNDWTSGDRHAAFLC